MKKIILFGFLALGPFMVAKSENVTVQYPALLKLKQQELGQLILNSCQTRMIKIFLGIIGLMILM